MHFKITISILKRIVIAFASLKLILNYVIQCFQLLITISLRTPTRYYVLTILLSSDVTSLMDSKSVLVWQTYISSRFFLHLEALGVEVGNGLRYVLLNLWSLIRLIKYWTSNLLTSVIHYQAANGLWLYSIFFLISVLFYLKPNVFDWSFVLCYKIRSLSKV